jgi:predicted adenylyl cyclase CyaB
MMTESNKELEIKLPIADLDQAFRAMEKLDATLLHERYFEDNALHDQPDDALARERRILRTRVITTPHPPFRELKTVLTYKGAPEIVQGIKQREEIECTIEGGQNLLEILSKLGYRITFRYQKFRSIYRPANVELDICIDETPIGNFYELEGEILKIHEFATKLGYNRDDYITQSYPSLYFRWCQKTGSKEPFMLFQSSAG